MRPKDVDGMANSINADQTAPLGAVWSGSTLFAQAYLFVWKLRNITVFFSAGVPWEWLVQGELVYSCKWLR